MSGSIGRLAVVSVLALTLAGCAGTAMVDATAPASGRVTWVIHDTYGSLLTAFSKAPGKKQMAGKLGAFATWTGLLKDGGTCEIHTLYPGGYPTEHSFGTDLAHEFRHCAEGSFHN